jgi:transmembrane sensor
MVSFDFGTQWRRATLANGEAFFRVAHDPNRPFIVNAQGVDVRAVGTAFAVRVDGGAVNVVVTEGKVAVSRPLSDPLPHAAPVNEAQLLAGQRATIALRQTSPVIVSDARSREIAHQTDWQPLLLDFSSAPLAVAIKELNRRNSVQFVLADESLAALPIIASIRSDNVEGFAEFLSSAPGVVVERTNTFEMIIRRRP